MIHTFFLVITSLPIQQSLGVQLTGSSPFAVLGRSFQFTCTETGSAIQQPFMTFWRGGTSVCIIENPHFQCRQYSNTPGYNCNCTAQYGSYELTISRVGLQDEDTWYCEIGETSNTISLPVYWFPGQPAYNCSSWVVLGQTESCTCQISDRGNPTGTVQWRNPASQTVSSSQSNSVGLNLTSIERSENSKNYICRAYNTLANSNKDTQYTVNIAFGPTGVIITGNQQISAPDVLTLTCTTTDHVNPAPTLTWKNSTSGHVFPGTSLSTLGSIKDGGSVYRSTLSITTQWYEDAHTIVCEGRNLVVPQQTANNSARLDINYPPQSPPVITGPTNTSVYEGDSVTFICRVSGGKPLMTTVSLIQPQQLKEVTLESLP